MLITRVVVIRLLELKPQAGLIQALWSQFKSHPVVEEVLLFTFHHAASLRLHRLGVYL